MKGEGYSDKGKDDHRKALESRNETTKKQGGEEEGNKEEYDPSKKGEKAELVSEEYQGKVHDLMGETKTMAHAAHVRHHLGKREDALREEENKAKRGDGPENFSTESMPATSY